MGTGNAPFIRPQSTACLLEGENSRKGRSWPGWGLRIQGGLPPPWSLALKPKLLYQHRYIQFPQESWGRGTERPSLGGKTEWEVARATEFPWVLEKDGFLPSPTSPICL